MEDFLSIGEIWFTFNSCSIFSLISTCASGLILIEWYQGICMTTNSLEYFLTAGLPWRGYEFCKLFPNYPLASQFLILIRKWKVSAKQPAFRRSSCELVFLFRVHISFIFSVCFIWLSSKRGIELCFRRSRAIVRFYYYALPFSTLRLMNIYRNLRGNQLTGELPWSDLPAIVYLLLLYFLDLWWI